MEPCCVTFTKTTLIPVIEEKEKASELWASILNLTGLGSLETFFLFFFYKFFFDSLRREKKHIFSHFQRLTHKILKIDTDILLLHVKFQLKRS